MSILEEANQAEEIAAASLSPMGRMRQTPLSMVRCIK